MKIFHIYGMGLEAPQVMISAGLDPKWYDISLIYKSAANHPRGRRRQSPRGKKAGNLKGKDC